MMAKKPNALMFIMLDKLAEVGADSLFISYSGGGDSGEMTDYWFEKDGKRVMVDASNILMLAPSSYDYVTHLTENSFGGTHPVDYSGSLTNLSSFTHDIYRECLRIFDMQGYGDGNGGSGTFTITSKGIAMDLEEDKYETEPNLHLVFSGTQTPDGFKLAEARAQALFDGLKNAMILHGETEIFLETDFDSHEFEANLGAFSYLKCSLGFGTPEYTALREDLLQVLANADMSWLECDVEDTADFGYLSGASLELIINNSGGDLFELTIYETVNEPEVTQDQIKFGRLKKIALPTDPLVMKGPLAAYHVGKNPIPRLAAIKSDNQWIGTDGEPIEPGTEMHARLLDVKDSTTMPECLGFLSQNSNSYHNADLALSAYIEANEPGVVDEFGNGLIQALLNNRKVAYAVKAFNQGAVVTPVNNAGQNVWFGLAENFRGAEYGHLQPIMKQAILDKIPVDARDQYGRTCFDSVNPLLKQDFEQLIPALIAEIAAEQAQDQQELQPRKMRI
ncbi:hypothetical protein ACKF11_13295 [Methylobacillus sp. Pita2]|uniref:hypothetical protein n=1 Tax=Methylobacillus sp. Pita2 TaxID=3383245 RepID=UPI0038B452D4